MEKTTLPPQDCQNCDFEEYCKTDPTGWCKNWRPDLYYKRLMGERDNNESAGVVGMSTGEIERFKEQY